MIRRIGGEVCLGSREEPDANADQHDAYPHGTETGDTFTPSCIRADESLSPEDGEHAEYQGQKAVGMSRIEPHAPNATVHFSSTSNVRAACHQAACARTVAKSPLHSLTLPGKGEHASWRLL